MPLPRPHITTSLNSGREEDQRRQTYTSPSRQAPPHLRLRAQSTGGATGKSYAGATSSGVELVQGNPSFCLEGAGAAPPLSNCWSYSRASRGSQAAGQGLASPTLDSHPAPVPGLRKGDSPRQAVSAQVTRLRLGSPHPACKQEQQSKPISALKNICRRRFLSHDYICAKQPTPFS